MIKSAIKVLSIAMSAIVLVLYLMTFLPDYNLKVALPLVLFILGSIFVSAFNHRKGLLLLVANFFVALISLIPAFGFLFRFAGIALSIWVLAKVSR
ncbi:MAG TPA: hypothetical protein VI564_08155 [Candidatus Nanoarchaeia archaeon]|nr:hypothetical protein [Candidatus Nanoarchaeia archaeon]